MLKIYETTCLQHGIAVWSSTVSPEQFSWHLAQQVEDDAALDVSAPRFLVGRAGHAALIPHPVGVVLQHTRIFRNIMYSFTQAPLHFSHGSFSDVPV